MRKVIALVIVVASNFGLLLAKPMEALSRYNVVLIHGAAPEEKGFESSCNGDGIFDAYTVSSTDSIWKLGDAVGMLGAYDRTYQPDSSEDWNENSGKKLTYWLDSAVFEDTITYGSEYIYLQRAFANPAASPAHNAHEIGDRTWKGNSNCSVRRSLFEEAQEVRARGAVNLKDYRENSVHEYRTIPSRNILIAHSMGGVASHEYVTDTSVYNNDVDKVITLDSPHEGTGALNMQLGMLLFCNKKRKKGLRRTEHETSVEQV